MIGVLQWILLLIELSTVQIHCIDMNNKDSAHRRGYFNVAGFNETHSSGYSFKGQQWVSHVYHRKTIRKSTGTELTVDTAQDASVTERKKENEKVLSLHSGNNVAVLRNMHQNIKLYRFTQMNWYQTAETCRLRGHNVVNINDKEDLKGLAELRLRVPITDDNPGMSIAWVDIHNFQGKWRNLKGIFPKDDIWEGGVPPSSVKPESCVYMAWNNRTYYLKAKSCKEYMRQWVVCEPDDPAREWYNYNCNNYQDDEMPFEEKYWTVALSARCNEFGFPKSSISAPAASSSQFQGLNLEPED